MAIPGRRWQQVWTFLSLDIIQPYREELWLSFLNLDRYKDLIRKSLDSNSHEDEDLMISSARICNAIYMQDTKTFFRLDWWARNVFVAGGHDREAEMMWTRLATVIAREGSDSFPQNWIFEGCV